MTTFVIRDMQNDVLIPLRRVVQRLSFLPVTTWCFRQVQVHIGTPFGFTVQKFERLTREQPQGFCVFDQDMRDFLDCGIQIVDGEIDAIANDGSPLFTIVCEDASQWEIRTSLSGLAFEMEKRGFVKQDE